MMLSPVPSLSALSNAVGPLVHPTALTGAPITTLPPALHTAFEGVPIFLVPTGGAANHPSLQLPLLQKAHEMKVNWAAQQATTPRIDTSKHFHVFVGDLSPEVDNKALKDAFTPFGEISDAKVIRDLQTLKSKGYGFVSYVNKEDAERAIEGMNGQWLGRRTIRTNWATRKPTGTTPGQNKTQSFDEIYNQTLPTNTTVYVGGITPTTTEEDLRKVFAKYGTIVEIRIFKQQGYAFVRFDNKESATHSIMNLNGADLNGTTIRCSWGRQGEGGSTTGSTFGYTLGLGGPTALTNGTTAGATAAAAAAWQQYWQQYYGGSPAVTQQWQSYWQQQLGGQ